MLNNQQPLPPSAGMIKIRLEPMPTKQLNNTSLPAMAKDKDQVKYGNHPVPGPGGAAGPGCCTSFWKRFTKKVWSNSLMKLCYKVT